MSPDNAKTERENFHDSFEQLGAPENADDERSTDVSDEEETREDVRFYDFPNQRPSR